jgi:hypothetical protein
MSQEKKMKKHKKSDKADDLFLFVDFIEIE